VLVLCVKFDAIQEVMIYDTTATGFNNGHLVYISAASGSPAEFLFV